MRSAGVMAAALVCLAACDTSQQEALAPPPQAASSEQAEYANPMESSVSPEQAARSGADATDQCRSAEAMAFVRPMVAGNEPDALGGYFTDARGIVLWGSEVRGGHAKLKEGVDFGTELHAVCWYTGSFSAPGVEGDTRMAGSIVVDFLLEPDLVQTVTASSANPIGIFAPPAPDPVQWPEAAQAPRTAHPQPEGIRILPYAPVPTDW